METGGSRSQLSRTDHAGSGCLSQATAAQPVTTPGRTSARSRRPRERTAPGPTSDRSAVATPGRSPASAEVACSRSGSRRAACGEAGAIHDPCAESPRDNIRTSVRHRHLSEHTGPGHSWATTRGAQGVFHVAAAAWCRTSADMHGRWAENFHAGHAIVDHAAEARDCRTHLLRSRRLAAGRIHPGPGGHQHTCHPGTGIASLATGPPLQARLGCSPSPGNRPRG